MARPGERGAQFVVPVWVQMPSDWVNCLGRVQVDRGMWTVG